MSKIESFGAKGDELVVDPDEAVVPHSVTKSLESQKFKKSLPVNEIWKSLNTSHNFWILV